MAGHTAAVNAVLVSRDGSKTVSAASDATVRVWNSDHTSRYDCMDTESNKYVEKPASALGIP